jgi:microcin C transport system permease protein
MGRPFRRLRSVRLHRRLPAGWQRFRRNRLGFWSLVLSARWWWPACSQRCCRTTARWWCATRGKPTSPSGRTARNHLWRRFRRRSPTTWIPFIKERITEGDNWAIYAPNPYGPKTLNYFAKEPNPSGPSRENWLGTDDRGRDLLAQLIYGFRVSVLFALALTAIGVLLGIVTGAIQGFFGGGPTWRSSASSRSGVPCPSCTC